MKKCFYFMAVLLLAHSSSQAAITLTDTVSNACNGTASGKVKLGASGGLAPYMYKIRGGSYQSSTIFQNLAGGSYTFYVMDNGGAVDSIAVSVSQSGPLSITGVVNASSQTITTTESGGTAPFSFYWPGWYVSPSPFHNDSSSIVGGTYPESLFPGIYYLQVTDHYGCVSRDSFTVPGSTTLRSRAVFHSPSCYASFDFDSVRFIGSGGTPYGGGPSLYSMRLNTGYQLGFTNVFNFRLYAPYPSYISTTIEDQVSDYTLTIPIAPIAPITVADTVTNCSGKYNNDGSIHLLVNGGQQSYVYQWSDGGAGIPNRNNLAPGTYTCTVLDAGGCSVVRTLRVIGPPILSDSVVNASCYGSMDGAVTLSTLHGVAAYRYRMGSGSYQSSGIFTGLAAGTHVFYVLDSLGQADSLSAIVAQPMYIYPAGTATATTGGHNNGSVTLSISGGTPPYHILWSTHDTTNSLQQLSPGLYIVVVTDSHGCTGTDTFNIGTSTGIASLTAEGYYLYPNPNRGTFTLQSPCCDAHEYRITDMLGQELMRQPISSENQTVDVSQLPDGMYLLVLNDKRSLRFMIIR